MKIVSVLKSRFYGEPESLVEREFKRLRKEIESGPRFQRQAVEFLDYRIDIVDNLSFIWQFNDIFVDESYLFNASHEDPLIYDCGANIGVSCLYFKRIFPHARIKAFEADPTIADVLEKNLLRNGFTDIEVVKKAVWVFNDPVDFGCQGADAGSIHHDTGRIKTDAVRLRDLIMKEEKIDFLKLDIEGAETDILIDCADMLGRIEHLFVEYHSWIKLDQRLDVILNILSENGFRYHLVSVAPRRSPLVNHPQDASIDMQVNIFAYRI